METDISSGIVPYRHTKDYREYLVLKSRTGDWEFPKGGIEGSEELQQAALRELCEETSITQASINDNIKYEYSYIFRGDNSLIYKKVHLFVAEVYNADVNLSPEHLDYQWRELDECVRTLSHESTQNILMKADRHLSQ